MENLSNTIPYNVLYTHIELCFRLYWQWYSYSITLSPIGPWRKLKKRRTNKQTNNTHTRIMLKKSASKRANIFIECVVQQHIFNHFISKINVNKNIDGRTEVRTNTKTQWWSEWEEQVRSLCDQFYWCPLHYLEFYHGFHQFFFILWTL